MLHIQDYMITEAYTERAYINDYSSKEVIFDTIQSTIDNIDNFSNTDQLKKYCEIISIILYHALRKTNGSVFLSFDPYNTSETKYPKISRSSISIISKALTDKVIKNDILRELNALKFYDEKITDIKVSEGKYSKLSIYKGKDGIILGNFGNGSGGKLSTKGQETFVCNVFNSLAEGIKEGENTDLDSVAEASKFVNRDEFDRLIKILDILGIENINVDSEKKVVTSDDKHTQELINAIKSGWDISFFKTCELIFKILKAKKVNIKEYKLVRFDDTIRTGDSEICKQYLELVNAIAKPLGIERNNVTTADALLYNNSNDAIAAMESILKKVKTFYTINKTDGKDNINDSTDKQKMTPEVADEKHVEIIHDLINLWKVHNIIGISLKKTDENAKAYRCNFSDDDNIRTLM